MEPAPAEIDRLVAQLGAARFRDRDAAQAALLHIGLPARDALERAAGGPDPEIALRAEAILSGLYLAEAFDGLARNPPPKPSAEQSRAIEETIQALREAARDRQGYQIDGQTAARIGPSGLPHVAALLRDSDPLVRWSAAQTLTALDRRASAPFLVGLLTDGGGALEGEHGPRDMVTVGRKAKNAIERLIPAAGGARLPADEEGTERQSHQAVQRWFAHHAPYIEWQQNLPATVNEVAVHTATALADLPALRRKQPALFKVVPFFQPDGGRSHARFRAGEAVVVLMRLTNLGTETLWVRWDPRDQQVHRLKMIGPEGRELPARAGAMPGPPQGAAEAQPVWAEGGGVIGWDLDVSKVWDLSQRGTYRLHYSYHSPKQAKPGQQVTPVEIPMRFWDGRRYVGYYEFVVW